MTEKQERRFWLKVDKSSSCWNWIGGKDSSGYGMFSKCNGTRSAHRISWFLFYKEVPSLQVLHSCDNPGCINPSHLFQGTHADNMQDMAKKGRSTKGRKFSADVKKYSIPYNGPRGIESKWAKTDEKTVLAMRLDHSMGIKSRKKLAEKYGIGIRNVSSIVERRSWRYL